MGLGWREDHEEPRACLVARNEEIGDLAPRCVGTVGAPMLALEVRGRALERQSHGEPVDLDYDTSGMADLN